MSAETKQRMRIAFKRMERDEELAERYHRETGDRMISWRDSTALDTHVNSKGVYRRVVEDEA